MKIYEQITRQTWCKGKSYNGKSWCAFQWLEKVYGKNLKEFKESYLKLRKAISYRPIVGWNDSEHTEYNDVFTAFRKANI